MPYYNPLKKMSKDDRLRTTENLLKLRKRLDVEIPQKTASDTLLLATWNIREFSDNRLNWDYIVTDSTDGSAGCGERMAFLYDKSKITFKKMAGEWVELKIDFSNQYLERIITSL